MDSNKPGWQFSDFRFWMVVISLTLLIWWSIQHYPGL